MKNISQSIADLLRDNGVISNEQVDIVRYGIDYFIVSVLELLSVLVISAFVGNFVDTFVYFLSFVPLRIYAGGYHADSKVSCYIILLGVYALFTILMRTVPLFAVSSISFVAIALTLVMIFAFSPVINSKKNVGKTERNFYKKVSIVIALIETALIIAGLGLGFDKRFVLSFSLGQLAVSLSMIAAFVKTLVKEVKANEKGKTNNQKYHS